MHYRALLASVDGMGYVLDERLPLAERPGQHDFSRAAYLQITAELHTDRIIVLKLQEFSPVVSATVTDLYPAFAGYVPPRTVTIKKLLELSHLIVRDPSGILRREPRILNHRCPRLSRPQHHLFHRQPKCSRR